MPCYAWQGRDRRGGAVSGELEAANEDAVANHLLTNNLIPIKIAITVAKEKSTGLALSLGAWKKTVKLGHLIFFCRQLHTLLRAGVPIFTACESLQQSNRNSPLGPVLTKVLESLNAGNDFATSLRRQEGVFSPLFIGFVEMGETSGTLTAMLAQLARYLELEQETRSRIKAAMRYPMIVMGAISVAMMVINVMVIPAFAQIYSKFKADLPWQTRVLIATSDFTVHYWYVILVALVAAAFVVRNYLKTPVGRYHWDRWKLFLPVLGPVFKSATLGRFARAMALNMRAGMPWDQAMHLVGQAVDNTYVQRHVHVMRDGIEQGKSLAVTAGATGLFPPLVMQMLNIGEQSGAVDELMEEVADYYEREVDYGLKALSAAVEPILTVVIGGMVLVLALGVFMPMWKLASVALPK